MARRNKVQENPAGDSEQVINIRLKAPHAKQEAFVTSQKRRIIIRAGRRGGKTTGVAIKAVTEFLKGNRVLYAAPTAMQIDKFWQEVTDALYDAIKAGYLVKNETTHTIRMTKEADVLLPDETLNVKDCRLRAKTAWNAETLRGDWGHLLIFDEWQMMNEDAWEVVGAPMMLDANGQAVFIYTPPSRRTAGTIKARDPRHASKMFAKALQDPDVWDAFTFTSHDNPHLDRQALLSITKDMSRDAYHQEIMAEDDMGEEDWLVFRAFDEETCIVPRFPIPQNWPVYVGHDFGMSNPAALFFAQDPATGFFYAFEEYLPGKGYSTSQHVDTYKRITEGMTVMRCVGGAHGEQEIREGYTAHGWPVKEPLLSGIAPQLDRVIGLMERNKIYVFDDLLNFREELMNCLWELDRENRPTNRVKDEQKYHLTACARYILSEFTPETVEPRKKSRTRILEYFR